MERSLHNIRFNDFCRLVEWFGFVRKGGRGSHVTYCYPGIREILDIQNFKGEAKPYQIRQFLRLVEQYSLKGGK
ncbi:MAG: type II toxin-antitoxin system HicA family toxin [Deltaproteobacteria bacterium]|nr:type II toxin-antitoxin system HicA family toxin [Deltaproteobacteria bacterium]